jgi:type II secretion system protein H
MTYPSHNGFTLIELLVATAVMGLLVSLVSLSVDGLGGRDTSLVRMADRLHGNMQQASHEAVLRGEAIGLHILSDSDQQHLLWSRWHGGRWLADLPALPGSILPGAMQLSLSVDGMSVPLMQALPQNRTPDTALSVPVLVFYPTGEANSFRLTLANNDTNRNTRQAEETFVTLHNTRTGWLEWVSGAPSESISGVGVR